ncbi:MAG: PIN domain-containing protein [Desulfamplus sp.]|nr:PIN domain-containing protein [Desulfamplus sp.]
MIDNIFIDTNIWIYAFLGNEQDNSKQLKTLALFEEIPTESKVIISIQVVNEFHWILTRKYKISEELINEKVIKGIVAFANIVPLDFQTYQDALRVRSKYTISFWDSLIIASALDNRCNILYSEDMQHGMVIDHRLKILNPFVE